MQQQRTAIRAAIDIGSNTIEVLIARCVPDNLEFIEHQSTLSRLGESVDSLERLLHRHLQLREGYYHAFRQHWYQLQARDFRRELQDVLK